MPRSHPSSALILGGLLALPAYGQTDGERDAALAEVTAVLCWEIVHFNLTFPVPNALVEDVVARIRELGER